ncbi:WD-repeat protein, partial [Reticulomyxa filosa]
KKSQNNLQQELLKHLADIELLKREFAEKEQQMIEQNNEVTKSLQEKDEQIDRLSKQNNTYQDESKQLILEIKDLQLRINNNDAIATEIDQLKRQTQNKNDEMNTLKQEIQLKIMEIVEKEERIRQLERDIEITKKDFNDKEKQSIKILEENNLKLLQHSQVLSEQSNGQNKKEDQKQPNNRDIPPSPALPVSTTFNFDTFCTSSKSLKKFSGHTSAVNSIDYSTFSGHYICSGSYDKTIRVWDIETTKQIQIFNEHSNCVNCVKFSTYYYYNQRRNVICSSSNDKTIRFWDFKDNQQLQVLNEHTDTVWGIEFSSFNGGRYLCSGSYDKTIRLWDVETSKSLHVFNGHTNIVLCVDFSPLQNNDNNYYTRNSIGVIGGNGYTICSGSYDNTICVWDIETTKQLIIFKGHENAVRSAKYGSNESNILLSGSSDKSVRLWDIRSQKQIQVFNGHTNWVMSVEYSPFVVNNGNIFNRLRGESNIICSGSRDNTIRFWDIRSNKKELHVIKEDKNEDNEILCFKFLLLKRNEKKKNMKNRDYSLNLCYGSFKGSIHIWG